MTSDTLKWVARVAGAPAVIVGCRSAAHYADAEAFVAFVRATSPLAARSSLTVEQWTSAGVFKSTHPMRVAA